MPNKARPADARKVRARLTAGVRLVDETTSLRQDQRVAHDFPESDWRVFRELRALALQRLCERALSEIRDASVTPDKSAHERFLAVYKLIHERNEDLARGFDDPRRSQFFFQLAVIKCLGLIEPEELARFSPASLEKISILLGDDSS